MSSNAAPLVTLLVIAFIGVLTYSFGESDSEKKAKQDEERKKAEELRRVEFERNLDAIVKVKEEADRMVYEAHKEWYDKKRIRDEKRQAKEYWSPKYGDKAKFYHDGTQYVIFDIETTGLNYGRSQITEIAAVRYLHDEPTESFQTLVKLKKGTRVGPKVVQLTGITTELLKEKGIELEEALQQFLKFIGDDRLLAYNIEFDITFIEVALNRKLENKQKCIYRMATQKWKNRPSYKLVDLAKSECWTEADGAHRAMRDIELAHELLMAIVYDQI